MTNRLGGSIKMNSPSTDSDHEEPTEVQSQGLKQAIQLTNPLACLNGDSMVSSTNKESRPDYGKKFSIFTGMKRLLLRPKNKEERVVWTEALMQTDDMYPLMEQRLRQRLMEEGVSEAAIKDSEQIIRKVLAAMHNQVLLLKQKQYLLIDTLRQLEVEEVDLENAVDANERQHSFAEGSSSDSDDDDHHNRDNNKGAAAEEHLHR